MAKQPTSVRWDEEKLSLVMEKEKLNSVQKVFTYLLDKYWWEHKIGMPIQNVPTNNSYSVSNDTQFSKPKIVRSQQYFEKIIMDGGCKEPEDHKIFIQEVNESNLSDRIKQTLITASRTIQS